MQPFRILYFRQSILKRAEIADGDLLEVIEQATDNRSEETAEIWSEDLGKVGIVEPLPLQQLAPAQRASEEPGSEIATEMKQRLDLVQEPARKK